VDVPDEDRRRVHLWMDLNIPYYGTSSPVFASADDPDYQQIAPRRHAGVRRLLRRFL